MSSQRGGLLAADFFTAAYRMSGHVDAGKRRLADILSDRLSDFLLLQDIYVSRIYRPGEIVAHPRAKRSGRHPYPDFFSPLSAD
jgi:hypothetical protein